MTAFRSIPTVLLDRLNSNSTIAEWPSAIPDDVADRRKGLDRKMRNAAHLDIAEVLVLDARQVMLHSAKRPVLHMRFAFDREFSAMVKEMVPDAVYSQATNGWKVPYDAMGDDAMDDFADLLCSRFATILIHDPKTMLKPTDPSTGKAPAPFVPPVTDVGFAALPFDVLVTRERIVEALSDTGQTAVEAIHYDDGRNLVRWDDDAIHTRMPFLLVRFSTGAKPRYAEYSTLSGMIVSTRYHGEKDASAMIARNRHAVLATGLPVVSRTEDVVQETWQLRMQARRIDPAFDAVCARQHETGAIPVEIGLVNPEHLTVTRRTDGAAAHHHGIIAYVEMRSREHVRKVMRRLAPHIPESATPVVVTPQFLEMRDAPDAGFLRMLAHEAAHVVEDRYARKLNRSSAHHDVAWRIHDAMIAASMGVRDEPSPGLVEYLDENGMDREMARVVEGMLCELLKSPSILACPYPDRLRIVSDAIAQTMDVVDLGEDAERRLKEEVRLVDECDILDYTFRVRLDPESTRRLSEGGVVMASGRPDCPCAGLSAGLFMNGDRSWMLVMAVSADEEGNVQYAAIAENGDFQWHVTNGRVIEGRLDFSRKMEIVAKPARNGALPLTDAIIEEHAKVSTMESDRMSRLDLEMAQRINVLRRVQTDVTKEYVERMTRIAQLVHDDLERAIAEPANDSRH